MPNGNLLATLFLPKRNKVHGFVIKCYNISRLRFLNSADVCLKVIQKLQVKKSLINADNCIYVKVKQNEDYIDDINISLLFHSTQRTNFAKTIDNALWEVLNTLSRTVAYIRGADFEFDKVQWENIKTPDVYSSRFPTTISPSLRTNETWIVQ